MTTPTKPRTTPVVDTLLNAARAVERLVERRWARSHRDVPLSATALRLLIAVDDQPGIKPSDLAALLLQETHSVSGLLNRIEDAYGLIERDRDHVDRRVVHVRLTAAGIRLIEEARICLSSVDDLMDTPQALDATLELVASRALDASVETPRR